MLDFFNNWKDRIAQYVDVRFQLFKLEFIDRTSNVLSYVLYALGMLFLFIAILIFFGIGLGEWFSEMLGSRTGGYFATAGVYLVLMLIVVALRKKFISALSGIFIRILTEDKDDDSKQD
ncbi:phage holin family protein [Chitinophagaceae bacterium MMS25-I14]